MGKMAKNKKITMDEIYGKPQYRGKHVIVVAGKVFTARTGEGAAKILEKMRRQYPKETPAITYIPDADALILFYDLKVSL